MKPYVKLWFPGMLLEAAKRQYAEAWQQDIKKCSGSATVQYHFENGEGSNFILVCVLYGPGMLRGTSVQVQVGGSVIVLGNLVSACS